MNDSTTAGGDQRDYENQLASDLRAVIGRWHRLRWAGVAVLAAVVVMIIIAGAAALNRTSEQLRDTRARLVQAERQLAATNRRLLSSCDFYRPLAGAAVTVPRHGQPSLLGVQIIASSREAYAGQRCPGPLPPPSPSLLTWAARYHVPVTGATPRPTRR